MHNLITELKFEWQRWDETLRPRSSDNLRRFSLHSNSEVRTSSSFPERGGINERPMNGKDTRRRDMNRRTQLRKTPL